MWPVEMTCVNHNNFILFLNIKTILFPSLLKSGPHILLNERGFSVMEAGYSDLDSSNHYTAGIDEKSRKLQFHALERG